MKNKNLKFFCFLSLIMLISIGTVCATNDTVNDNNDATSSVDSTASSLKTIADNNTQSKLSDNDKINTNLTVSATNTTLGKNSTISGTLKDASSKPLNATVKVSVYGGAGVNVNVVNGIYSYKYTTSQVGQVNVNVIYDGNDTYSSSQASTTFTVNKITSKLTLNTTGIKLGSNTITGTLKDENSNPIGPAVIIIKLNSETPTYVPTNTNGVYTTPLTLTKVGSNTITVSYEGDGTYNSTSLTRTVNVTKLQTTTTASVIDARLNDTINLTATVVDSNGDKVNEGTVIFRINGTNLLNGSSLVTAKVSDGVARTLYKVQTSWLGNTTKISAVFNGTNTYYNSTSKNATVKVVKHNATISLLTEAGPFKAGETMVLRLLIKEGDRFISNGQVIFKLNGITLKDSNGDAIYADVKDGLGVINYKIPEGFLAVNYTLTGVFGGGIYERYEENTTLSIVKSVTHLTTSVLTTNTKTARLYAEIYDGNNKKAVGISQITVKINGVTVKSGVNITNGVINFTINTNFKAGLYTVLIIAGENHAYDGTKAETNLIIL